MEYQKTEQEKFIYPGDIFQLKDQNNWIYKIILNNQNRAIDCKLYSSNSGLTSEGCYKVLITENKKIEAKLVRGLWIAKWKKLEVTTDFKITVNQEVFLKNYEDFLKYLSPGKYLIKFSNYGISAYIAYKAPTLKPKPTLEQGHLSIYRIEQLPSDLEFNKQQLIYFNHYTDEEIDLRNAYSGIITKIEKATEIKSDDHNPILLEKGVYLLVHPPTNTMD